jgi:prepilin-type N-terminal cleavage/methylation domain-containing protein
VKNATSASLITARRQVPCAGVAGPFAQRRGGRRGRGVSLVEMMISLAISAAILVSVACAVDVSFRAYSVNQEQSTLMQRARLAMHRITTQIRMTALHQPVAATPLADFKAGKVTTDKSIILYDAANNQIAYKYNAGSKELYCVDIDGNEFVALRGVEAFSIKFEPMRSQASQRSGGVYDLLMRATITMTVKTVDSNADVDEKLAAQTITLTESVVPRCNVW